MSFNIFLKKGKGKNMGGLKNKNCRRLCDRENFFDIIDKRTDNQDKEDIEE
jgi:hypothetical protein